MNRNEAAALVAANWRIQKRLPHLASLAQQLAEDAEMGDPQARGALARAEDLAGPVASPFCCHCGAIVEAKEMHDHLEAHCREIERTGGLLRLKDKPRRSTATLADIEGEPEAEMLPRNGRGR